MANSIIGSYQMNGIPSSSSSSSNNSFSLPPINNNNHGRYYFNNNNNNQQPTYRYFDEAPHMVVQNPPSPPSIQYRVMSNKVPKTKNNIQYVYYQDESDENDYYDNENYEFQGNHNNYNENENGYYFINGSPSKSIRKNKVYAKPSSSYYYENRQEADDDGQELYYEYADEPIVKRKSSNIVYVKSPTPKQKVVYVQQNKRASASVKSPGIFHFQSKPIQYEIRPRLSSNTINEERSQSKSKYIYL